VAAACALLCAPGPAAAGAGAGGAAGAEPVRVTGLRCERDCAGPRAARPGSTVRVMGRGLSGARTVIFLAGPGLADNAGARVVSGGPRSAVVVVPRCARSGRVRVIRADGAMSRAGRASIAIEHDEPADGPVAVRVSARKVFFDGERPATLEVAPQAAAIDVGVELVRTKDGASIARWQPGIVQPGAPARISWDGLAGGRVQREGRYEFRVYAREPGAATIAQAPRPAATSSFVFLRHAFPVQGPHGFGEFAATFGGGRGHKGQDVFAACGTPIVAARGGTVRWKAWQDRAGNYLVIDGEATGIDYAYMHLRDPTPLERGQKVKTGQLIGHVGDTGRAHGCHLHFEMWSAPGWYRGGAPFDPLPSLRAWDRAS
jgi:murein DD-endopeptidase MepM/ murein hydrolase activator NlpD